MLEPIYTGIRYCRRKILIESTGDGEVDAALKEAFLRDYRHTGANEMWRPHVKRLMLWMQEEDAKGDREKAKRERDKYALFDTAKGV